MKNLSNEQLQAMNLKAVSEIAKKLNITLSFKDENGKRKRFTKNELISKITSILSEIKVKNSSTYCEVIENNFENESKNELVPAYNLTNVVTLCKSLLKDGKTSIVKSIIDKLINDINNERKNKLLIKNMSLKVQILKHLLVVNKKGSIHA